MTPGEVAKTSSVGVVLLLNMAKIVVTSTLFGMYCLACCISLYIHFNYSTRGIIEQVAAANAQSQGVVYDNICFWLSNIICGELGDCGWTIRKYRWDWFVRMGASIADGIGDSLAASLAHFNNAITLDWVTVVLSLSVNIIATCLIAFRAWSHHRSVGLISFKKKQTKGQRILLLLVESGGVYALFQLFSVITNALSVNALPASPVAFAAFLAAQVYVSAAALNPVAIIIIVQTQNTYEESFQLEEFSTSSISEVQVP
ncbi:hypothetical protein BDP27DRAFT_1366100 [Rhodocollybia butyracea]|uniref:Uncharacterized protein n=1 Tax=Rhodocollybia butyracea TaxID=206335 RepID=A0A9P5PHL6_9AGAR|nr:hypothetical protein BDP27DRAFT_1366100 [Rhodocollybia butyracea]